MMLTIAGMISVAVVSCRKDNEEVRITNDDLQDTKDDAMVEEIYSEVMNEASANLVELENNNFSPSRKSSVCPSITVDHPGDSVFPKKITIDYGDGCEQLVYDWRNQLVDTIVRKGKMVIDITGRYREEGASKTLTLVDYYINDIAVEGTRTISNKGKDENGNTWFQIVQSDGKITTPDGVVITRESSRERHWVAGEKTPTPWDDEYLIWGSVNGVNARGENYSRTIIDSLRVKLSCRFVTAGIIEFKASDREAITLDYGTGDCDATAVASKGLETKTITLRKRRR